MNESDIRRLLSEVGLRATYPRIALITELGRTHTTPKSAPEITATLSQFPRSTIYRSLEALERQGLIKSSLIKWVRRYELGDSLAPHHHHLMCVQCNKMIDFDSSKLESHLEAVAKDHHMQLASHVVELRGICSDCQETQPTKFQKITGKLRAVATNTPLSSPDTTE
ncbi:MAG: Fur family transcriptional regulator [Candidatus Saccharimonadales bacterium]